MASISVSLRMPYKVVDKTDIPTDIYLPATTPAPAQACPVLIMIHGGAFMLGHAGMNNKDQIQDCVDRGWIVLALEHRLCPGVHLLGGPMADVRDALVWVQNGGLSAAIEKEGRKLDVDAARVMVMGTSSGGHLALSTAWNAPVPPLAILDFYGAKHFSDLFWSQRLNDMPAHFYDDVPTEQAEQVKSETCILIGGVSLEGQAASPSTPDAPDPKIRTAFAMNAIATGKVIPTIYPPSTASLQPIDPMLNVNPHWPPVAIVHGTADTMIPMRLSQAFQAKLQQHGVETAFFEVEGEPHTFCGKMVKGSRTWDTQRKGFDWLQHVLERSYARE